MIIEVTQEDIDEAKKYAPRGTFIVTTCPIARAAARATGHPVRVTNDRLTVNHSKTSLKILAAYDLPLAAEQFIVRFDHQGPVTPFTFEVSE